MKSDGNAMKARFPPNYLAVPTCRRRFRFVSQAVESKGSDPVTAGSIAALQFIPISSLAANSLFAAFRVTEVEIFSGSLPANIISSFSTIELEWVGSRCPNICIGATGDQMFPAHIKSRPPKGSYAEMWTSVSGADTNTLLFSLSGPAGSVCDVTIEYQQLDGEALSGLAAIVMSAANAPGFVWTNGALDSTTVAFGAGVGNWLTQNMSAIATAYASSL